jgi:sarcosine oxidase subunit gamma
MSDRASALQGASFKGQIAVRENGLRGMITLRGDLASVKLRNAATTVTGLHFPDRRSANSAGEMGLCWMSPDELLILLPYAEVAKALGAIGSELKDEHHLAVEVSDARASFTLQGKGADIRNVLAKLTPADLRPAALPTGEMRRTRLAQVPAAIWFHEEGRAELICFRSVAGYVWGLLVNAAEAGSEVRYY